METPENNSSNQQELKADAPASDAKLPHSDNSDSSNEVPVSSTTPKVVLRPSSLAAQTEKLKTVNTFGAAKPITATSFLAPKNKESTEADSTSTDNNCKNSVIEASSVRLSTSFSDPITLKCSQSSTAADSSFGLFSVPTDKQSNTGGFVFGQNLHERASNYGSFKIGTSPVADAPKPLSFESLQKEKEETIEEDRRTESLKRTLTDAAKEYESKKIKTVLEEVSVVTGEEEEMNVLQINCRLFAFNNESKSWQERSRGILRLNDKERDGAIHSRVVVRTQGSLRVVLNTKVWSEMTVEHASEKTIRLTAIDSDGIKVFLVMTCAKDADLLFNALTCRIATLKSSEKIAGKTSNVNELSVDESASLSSTFDVSSSDSFQDFSRQNFRNIQAGVVVADADGDSDPKSAEKEDDSHGSIVKK